MWTIDGDKVFLAHERLQGVIDLMQPWLGLRSIHIDAKPLAGAAADANQILGVDFRSQDCPTREQVAECYLRGNDLVVTYSDPPPRRIRPQIYWRVIDDVAAGGLGLEAIVSVQTELLDSRPAATTHSCLPAVGLFRMTSQLKLEPIPLDEFPADDPAPADVGAVNVFVLCLAQGGPSYVEMAHRSDISRAELSSTAAGNVRLGFHLFDEHLEKGVIRRARVRGMFVPRDKDRAATKSCYRSFLDSELPLTT